MRRRSKIVQLLIFAFVILMLFALCTTPGGKKGEGDKGGIPPPIDPPDTNEVQLKSIPPEIDPIDTTQIEIKKSKM